MLLQVDQAPPGFAPAAAVLANIFSELRFPEKVSVSEATRRHRVLNNPGAYSGPWSESPHDLRFLDRIMDALNAESPYREVVHMGPSQVGKSEVGNNWQLHTILYDPADILFVMPDRTSIDSYVKTQFNKMLDEVPALRARQLAGASADNINLKQFRGCDFHFLWPTGPTFRAKPIPRGRLDDYDDIPTDIGEQGDALSLMLGRMASFSAYGRTKVYVNSSPKLGRNAGIEALVDAGTNERWYVDCLACGEPFILDTHDCLRFDNQGSPADAAASAVVMCPHEGCGGAHTQQDKRRLMGTGRWVGVGETAISGGKEGVLLDNPRQSSRSDGLMGMRPWSEMASLARSAEIKFALEQDDGGLKAFDQTIAGRNYTPRHEGEAPVTEDALQKRAKASPYKIGEVPAWAICLIASIDQQGNRFEGAVWAFGAGFRSHLVDRFPLLTIEENGRAMPLRPFTRAEHFAVLHPEVLSRTYPIAGAPDLRMKIFNTVIDTGGLDNATANAFDWWHAMVRGDVASGRSPIPATAITLFKGGNNPKGKLLPPPTIDTKRQIKGAPQAEMFIPNVHRVKDIFDTRLKRMEDGPGFVSFPRDIDHRYLAELRAEQRQNGLWVRDQHSANETWDLYVMAYTAILRFGESDASLSWVPAWARPPRGALRQAASLPVSVVNDDEPDPEPARVQQVQRPGTRQIARPMRRQVRMVRSH